MPPIATTGTSTATQIATQPLEPDRRIGVGLRRRRPDRAGAEVVGVGCDRLLDASRPSGRAQPVRAGALGACVGLAEMHAVGAERDRRVDVVVDDERHAELGEARDRARRRPRVGAFTRNCTTVAPAATACCAVSSSSTIACTLT